MIRPLRASSRRSRALATGPLASESLATATAIRFPSGENATLINRRGPSKIGVGQDPIGRTALEATSTRFSFDLVPVAVTTASVRPSGENLIPCRETEASSRTVRASRESRWPDDADRRRVFLQDSEQGTAGLRKVLQRHAGHRE